MGPKCSSCGSEKIKVKNPGQLVTNYNCSKCGHKGNFIITEGFRPRRKTKR